MNHPDFKCSIEDNHGILIIIHAIDVGRAKDEAKEEIEKILESVTRFRQLCFENTPREIHFRYQTRQSCLKQDQVIQQIHRRVFGLICVAVLRPGGDSEKEKIEILQQYNGYLAHYGSTLLESRCLVFRSTQKPPQKVVSDSSDGALVSKKQGTNGELPINKSINQSTTASVNQPTSASINQSSAASLGRVSGILFNPSTAGLNGSSQDSLRPVHKSFSETNLSAAVSGNSNSAGKSSKNYVEILLQDSFKAHMSQVMEDYLLALFSSVEVKRPMSVPDKVDKEWKGSNLSMEKLEPVKKDGFKFDLPGGSAKKKKLGWMKKTFAEWLLIAGMPYPACQYFAQAVDMLQSAKETLQLASALEGWAAASYYVLPAADSQLSLKIATMYDPDRVIVLTRTKAASLNGYLVNGFNLHVPELAKDRRYCLTSDNIYEKLRLAANTYSFAEKGDLELEVSLKSAKLFMFLGDKILAHNGLRQATFVKIDTFPNDSSERIERFLTIAELYEEIGFSRQAALFRLLAADRCIGSGNSPATYTEAFRLTVKSLGPYSLNLSTKPTFDHGWPELQAQVLVKLAASCRTQPEIYTRILLIILETFSDVLSMTEKDEMLKSLIDLIAHHGPPVGDVSTAVGIDVGVVSLTKIPFVHEFTLMPLPNHLQPLQRPKLKRGISGPFLYTPIKNTSHASMKDLDEANFMWVAKEPCGITLHLSNRLPRELRVENLTVETEDAPFDAAKASLVLPPIVGPIFPVVIAGIPLEPGILTVLGYSFSVFGIPNRCLISDLMQFRKNTPPKTVRIAPSLPQLKVETSWPPCDMFVDVGEPVVATASMPMFNGQRSTCSVKLLNIGREPIESLSVLVTSPDNVLVERCITFDSAALAAFLPIQPGDTAVMQLEIWAALSFISASESKTSDALETFQFVLRIDYSGGPGLLDNYYRLLSVAFFVDVIPSVAIAQWSILSAEEPEQFYLVVDFENRTDEEIEVLYPPDKKMLIIGRDRARIPALADKIPLLLNDSALAGENEFRKYSAFPGENEFRKYSAMPGENEFRKYMSDHIDLSWKFVEKPIHGRCWIGDLTWNTQQIDSLSLPPILVEFIKNDEAVFQPRKQGCSTIVGVPTHFKTGLKNRFSTPIPGLRVYLEFREESLVAQESSGSKIALIGGSSDVVLDFGGNETEVLNCQIVMLIPGVFHLDVVFEFSGRRWAVVDTCLVTVSAMTALTAQDAESSTDL